MSLKPEPTPRAKLRKMLALGKKLFAVPKAEYEEREAERKRQKPTRRPAP